MDTPDTPTPVICPSRSRPPRWYRWHRELSLGETTPAEIACKLGVTLDEALDWLYPENAEIQARVGRVVEE
jgi:hypothetical protein